MSNTTRTYLQTEMERLSLFLEVQAGKALAEVVAYAQGSPFWYADHPAIARQRRCLLAAAQISRDAAALHSERL